MDKPPNTQALTECLDTWKAEALRGDLPKDIQPVFRDHRGAAVGDRSQPELLNSEATLFTLQTRPCLPVCDLT